MIDCLIELDCQQICSEHIDKCQKVIKSNDFDVMFFHILESNTFERRLSVLLISSQKGHPS